MSRVDTMLMVAIVVMLLVFIAPAGEFFAIFLRRLTTAGFAAIAALAVLLLFRFLKRQ